jgi:hypothetical protein
VKKVIAKPLHEQKALLAGLLAGVGPTVSAEVMRSALADFGDEPLTARSGVSGSHHVDQRDSAGVIVSNGTPAAHSTMAMTGEKARASRCTICRSPDRQRIDQALAAGASVRDVAREEGLSKSVVGRHREHGLEPLVSHFGASVSGTLEAVCDTRVDIYTSHQAQPPRSVQLDLLALDTVG